MAIDVTLFTDPACPFAFSAEPVRIRLRWHYGDGLSWRLRMIVLTLEPGEAGKLAPGAPESVTELLAWAQEPLATAEIVAVMAAPQAAVRTELGRVAHPIPAGADFYWELPARPTI